MSQENVEVVRALWRRSRRLIDDALRAAVHWAQRLTLCPNPRVSARIGRYRVHHGEREARLWCGFAGDSTTTASVIAGRTTNPTSGSYESTSHGVPSTAPAR